MIDPEQQQRLFDLLIDGLDDLYDQRFGWPVGSTAPTVETWLPRLFAVGSLAVAGSEWETTLQEAADTVAKLIRSRVTGDDLNDQVLNATDALRRALAAWP